MSVPIGSLIFPLAASKLYHGYAGSSVEDVSSKLLAENSPVQAEATAAGTLHNAINVSDEALVSIGEIRINKSSFNRRK